VVEPYLSLQWYVKTGPLAERALAAVREGETRILPEQWEKNYYEWMENIHDWCISRQIWWGHRIPAWYCDHCGAVTVAMDDPAHCCQCGSDEMRQETDVLDTWFSSALWPFSTMGWPEKTDELAAFYPTSCLVTGFDILFFWVARMMMMGLHFMDQVPFKEVYIHALVRDAHGQKMSKSKGNVIDPLVIIDEYGADAFRFTLTAFAAMGRDIKLATERIAGYRAFANKLWNAARFTLMNLEGFTPAPEGLASLSLSLPDHWILKRLNLTAAQVNVALTEYKFNEVASLLYAFTWNDFCDWYIELVKDDLYGSDAVAKLRAQTVLYTVLEALLRLLHPLMPFITEEIWQSLPGTRPTTTIMYAPYPDASGYIFDDLRAGEMEQIMEIIRAIRNIRGEMDVNPGRQISVVFDCRNEGGLAVTRAGERYIRTLARVKEQTSAINVARPEEAATQVAGGIEILVPLAGLIDVAAEIERLGKEIAKVQKDVEMFEKKLGNEAFVGRAPAEVLEKDRAKLADATEKLAILNASRAKIQALEPSR
jgi:valyl-tRNA synthetase